MNLRAEDAPDLPDFGLVARQIVAEGRRAGHPVRAIEAGEGRDHILWMKCRCGWVSDPCEYGVEGIHAAFAQAACHLHTEFPAVP